MNWLYLAATFALGAIALFLLRVAVYASRRAALCHVREMEMRREIAAALVRAVDAAGRGDRAGFLACTREAADAVSRPEVP